MTGLELPAGEAAHATAIIVGQTGILFLGESGSGKSTTAFACLAAATARGWHAALVADDRTLLSVRSGRLVAACPSPIRGLIELRGSGIAGYPCLDRTVIHLAVLMQAPNASTRLPPDSETLSCNGVRLPLMRMWHDGAPAPLDRITSLHPRLFPPA